MSRLADYRPVSVFACLESAGSFMAIGAYATISCAVAVVVLAIPPATLRAWFGHD